jgi:hypothetical protein
MIEYGRFLHAVNNGGDTAINTPNFSVLLNQWNRNKVSSLLVPEINFFGDDLAITCTSVTPEYEEQTGRITQKIDTIIVKFQSSPLLKLLSPPELVLLLQRANKRYGIVDKMRKYQTTNEVKINDEVPIPSIALED